MGNSIFSFGFARVSEVRHMYVMCVKKDLLSKVNLSFTVQCTVLFTCFTAWQRMAENPTNCQMNLMNMLRNTLVSLGIVVGVITALTTDGTYELTGKNI